MIRIHNILVTDEGVVYKVYTCSEQVHELCTLVNYGNVRSLRAAMKAAHKLLII